MDCFFEEPFRAPHPPSLHRYDWELMLPGEVSLAHNGILFLDELAEYEQTL